MKYIIVGRHASGKVEVIDALEKYGVRVGREFCTLPDPIPGLYIDPNYERYTEKEVVRLFENNAYLYLSGTNENELGRMSELSRGISQFTFDNAQVIALRPEELVCLNHSCLRNDSIVCVWMDNNISQRIQRHATEERTYNFKDIEDLESDYDQEFVNAISTISKSQILYFSNEDPQRVALLIKVLIDHEEYLDKFLKIFT